MTATRLPHTPATPRLENQRPNTETRPACDGEWPLFWELIDHPGNPYARKEAAKFCGGCDLATKCLLVDNRDEDWAKAIVAELGGRRKETPCDPCLRADRKAARERMRRKRARDAA